MNPLYASEIVMIPVAEIICDETFNCRALIRPETLTELAESIREVGLQNPVVVQPVSELEPGRYPEQFRYRMLSGHRRYFAVRLLGQETIAATIRTNLTEQQARNLNFHENLQRSNLTCVEEAEWIAATYPDKTPNYVIQRALKKSQDWVTSRRLLAKMPVEIKRMVMAGLLNFRQLEAISEYPTDEEKIATAEAVKAGQISLKHTSVKGLRRSQAFKLRKSKKQLATMIRRLMEEGIEGLPVRLLSWAGGFISDREIDEDITNFVFQKASSIAVSLGEEPKDDSKESLPR